MTYTFTIFILFCGSFEVRLSQPETTKEAELKNLENHRAKLKNPFIKEDELMRTASELECKEAISFFTEAIRRNPAKREYYRDRGHAYSKMGKWSEAYADFLKEWMMYSNSGDPGNFRRLCSDLSLQKLYNEAILCYTDAIEIDPLEYVLYKGRADSYNVLGNYPSAALDYREALAKNPKNQESRTSLIRVLFLDGKSEEAVAELNVLDEPNLHSMGNAFLEEGKCKEALQCFTKAISKNSSNSDNHAKAAECYWTDGDYESAKFETEKAIDLLPLMTMRRINLQIRWCEKLVEAGKFTEARLALKNFEMECNSYGVPVEAFQRIAEIREKLTETEQKVEASPPAE